MVKIGEKIPDLEIDAYHKGEIKKIKLSDYRGQWMVLVFYPADFTFICPTELQELAEYYHEFKKLDAEISSVSTDTVFAHKVWHDISPAIKTVNYPMLADPAHKMCSEFGTHVDSEGLSLRATFIVDPEGIIKSMDIHDNSIGRSAAEILRKLQAARQVSTYPGNVCPAGWKPGAKTIKPTIELVGKI